MLHGSSRSPIPAYAKTIQVKPGDSIQAAVDLANPGDRIAIRPGTYHEAGSPCPTNASNTCALVVTKDNIRLVGLSSKTKPVIIENPGGQDQGIAIAKSGDASCLSDASKRVQRARVQGLTVNGFGGEGIFLFCVDDWRVVLSATNDNGEYGIWPGTSAGRGTAGRGTWPAPSSRPGSCRLARRTRSEEVDSMRHVFRAAALTLALAVAGPAWGQTATEIKKDLFPKYKKAQAEGKDLGEAGKEYEAGDKALKDGMPEEALEHFKKAKSMWPADGK